MCTGTKFGYHVDLVIGESHGLGTETRIKISSHMGMGIIFPIPIFRAILIGRTAYETSYIDFEKLFSVVNMMFMLRWDAGKTSKSKMEGA